MLRVTLISDTHTKERNVLVNGGDLILHSGDVMNSGYNWEDLYDLYDEDYMDKENQTIVQIKDIVFSQKHVSKIDQSYENEKPVLICVLKNKKYLIDGNHRVIKSAMNNESSINAYIVHYSDL